MATGGCGNCELEHNSEKQGEINVHRLIPSPKKIEKIAHVGGIQTDKEEAEEGAQTMK